MQIERLFRIIWNSDTSACMCVYVCVCVCVLVSEITHMTNSVRVWPGVKNCCISLLTEAVATVADNNSNTEANRWPAPTVSIHSHFQKRKKKNKQTKERSKEKRQQQQQQLKANRFKANWRVTPRKIVVLRQSAVNESVELFVTKKKRKQKRRHLTRARESRRSV